MSVTPHIDTVLIDDPFLNRRNKLLPCQLEMVAWWNDNSDITQQQLADMFKVSRRTISFILNPEAEIQNKKRRKERGGSKLYYDKDYHTVKMKESRTHKQSLLIDLNFKRNGE